MKLIMDIGFVYHHGGHFIVKRPGAMSGNDHQVGKLYGNIVNIRDRIFIAQMDPATSRFALTDSGHAYG